MTFSHKQSEEVKFLIHKNRKGHTRKIVSWDLNPGVQKIFAISGKQKLMFSPLLFT